MKQIHLTGILIYLFCFSGIYYTKAQQWNRFNNIVKINSDFLDKEPEEGFGFVVYERNDSLYIITAKHVIYSYSEKEFSIKVRFYNDSIDRSAELVKWHPTLDIGMIKVYKPVSYYAWEFRGNTKIPETGDKIEIIGRYGTWMPMPKQMRGKIIRCDENQFVANFYGAVPGSSGGPVMVKNNIAGMIIEDAGGKIFAIPIQTIEKTFHEWLHLKPQSIRDLPIIGFGINLGASSHQLTTNRYATMMDRSNEMLSFRPGIYAQLIPLRMFSFSAEANYRRVFKTTNTDYSADIQFENKYFTYSVSLNYNLFPNVGNPLAVADMENPFFPMIILGYSWNSMNPKIKYENNDREVLEDQLGVLPGYSKKINSWFVGLGLNLNIEMFNLKGEIIYERFDSKYLLMDLIDPKNSNDKNDWLVCINMKIGLNFRPKSSQIKLLR